MAMFVVSIFHSLNDGFTVSSSGVAAAMAVPTERQAGAQGLLGGAQTLVGGISALVAGQLFDHLGRAGGLHRVRDRDGGARRRRAGAGRQLVEETTRSGIGRHRTNTGSRADGLIDTQSSPRSRRQSRSSGARETMMQAMGDPSHGADSRGGHPVGTRDEFVAFYRLALQPVYRSASRLVGGDRQRCDDLVQDAFLDLVRQIRGGAISSVDVGWMIVAVRHRFLDSIRRRERGRAAWSSSGRSSATTAVPNSTTCRRNG